MRLEAIYEPKGRAREYAELACNLYSGCSHRCSYCYAPEVLRVDPVAFQSDVRPKSGILEKLQRDCRKLAGDPRHVLLCFTCDPYQPAEVEYRLTRSAIQILHSHDMHVSILTKGNLATEPDWLLLDKGDRFGVTLTFMDANKSKQWEPGAAWPEQRLRLLRTAYNAGIPTWVSLEPVIEPEETIKAIFASYRWVDEYRVGRWNHDQRAENINWPAFANRVVSVFHGLVKSYVIKEDLAIYLPEKVRARR